MNNENAPERVWLPDRAQYEGYLIDVREKPTEVHPIKYIRADLVDQIPGRCVDCAYKGAGKDQVGQYSYCTLNVGGGFNWDGFCHEFKPKDSSK